MQSALRFLGWPTLCGVLFALLLMQIVPDWLGLASRRSTQPISYAEAVANAAPAVVNLYTARLVSRPLHPLLEDPLFRRFFEGSLPRQQRMEASLGSAVIMNKQGYLLTNNHVVSGAEQIIVALQDGRETTAQLIGKDPETDLAVLKIDLPDLPVIHPAESNNQRIGDVALAIGNPFGVGQTVTMGIISATGRNQLGLNTYEDFIQTDAAINPGNSGGALINAKGQLIGINTATLSGNNGAHGIGFAIPLGLAQEVMQAITLHGAVIRGWLGVDVQPLPPELAQSFGLNKQNGILIVSVHPNGPAQQAGLQAGDVILSINGQSTSIPHNAMNQVARTRPGEQVTIELLRSGKHLTRTAEISRRQPEIDSAGSD